PLDLIGILTRLRGHVPRAFVAIQGDDLRVGGRKVVVPEERHLLLERTTRMNHAEEPTLPRIVDHGARQELTSCRDQRVPRLPYQAIDIVRYDFVIEQPTNRSTQAKLEVVLDLVVAGAETSAPQQVLDDVLAVPYPVALSGIATRLLHRFLPPAQIIPLPSRG